MRNKGVLTFGSWINKIIKLFFLFLGGLSLWNVCSAARKQTNKRCLMLISVLFFNKYFQQEISETFHLVLCSVRGLLRDWILIYCVATLTLLTFFLYVCTDFALQGAVSCFSIVSWLLKFTHSCCGPSSVLCRVMGSCDCASWSLHPAQVDSSSQNHTKTKKKTTSVHAHTHIYGQTGVLHVHLLAGWK